MLPVMWIRARVIPLSNVQVPQTSPDETVDLTLAEYHQRRRLRCQSITGELKEALRASVPIDQHPCKKPCRDPDTRRAASPQRRSSNANNLCDQNSAESEKSVRLFKAIVRADISEFESHMPSHAVRSPPANMPQRCFALRQPAEILACCRKRPESRFRLFAQ